MPAVESEEVESLRPTTEMGQVKYDELRRRALRDPQILAIFEPAVLFAWS